MGHTHSRPEDRQLESHEHIAVNGRPTNVPSFGTSVGDRIEVRESRQGRDIFAVARENMRSARVPEWLSSDAERLSATILSEPAREQMPLEFNEQLIVEYYSR